MYGNIFPTGKRKILGHQIPGSRAGPVPGSGSSLNSNADTTLTDTVVFYDTKAEIRILNVLSFSSLMVKIDLLLVGVGKSLISMQLHTSYRQCYFENLTRDLSLR
jgi:hypothetical protein